MYKNKKLILQNLKIGFPKNFSTTIYSEMKKMINIIDTLNKIF